MIRTALLTDALADVAGALGSLPNPHESSDRQELRATGTDERPLRADKKEVRTTDVKTTLRLVCGGKIGKEPSRTQNGPEPQGEQQVNEAEGRGFEPPTPFGAPDFESGCWPIRLPSSGTETILRQRLPTTLARHESRCNSRRLASPTASGRRHSCER